MKDTLNTIKCPACGKEMTKVFVADANCHVDICVDGCGGIFFDNREYKKFDEQHENIDEILAVYKDKIYNKTNESSKRTCPVCGCDMVKHYASRRKEIEIDECYGCGGVFLDYKELEAIRSQYKTEEERSSAFIEMFEQEHDVSEFKDYQQKNIDETFGNKIFEKGSPVPHLIYNKGSIKLIKFLSSKLF